MDKKYALCIIIGLAVGAVFGTAFSPVIGNNLLTTGLGVFGGLFIGWLFALVMHVHENNINS